MAVTLTGAQLAAALRLGSSAMETAMVERLLASGTAEIERHLGGAYDDCPEAIVNEALIRLAGHRYDSRRPALQTLSGAPELPGCSCPGDTMALVWSARWKNEPRP